MEVTQRPSVVELLDHETYRPEELAELLSMDLEVIRQAVFAHLLPATMVGHDIVAIRRSDVLRWLEERG
jgi:excisionase family DNA binding protein